MAKKLRVMVLYGGRSGEHEVSLRSAASVLHYLDRERFEPIPVAIDKNGKWLFNDISLINQSASALPVFKDATPVVLLPEPESSEKGLTALGPSKGTGGGKVDVIFPVMHGPLCEDGTVQGLFELAEMAYVGSGVLASAVGMDKDVGKRLAKEAGLPIVPYLCFKADRWDQDRKRLLKQIQTQLRFPVFVKPARLGSSVGIHKVKNEAQLEPAIVDAFRYDTKVLVEQGLEVREIELSVLENTASSETPLVSVPGEIVPSHEFYTYDAKYIDADGAKLLVPAPLDEDQIRKAQQLAKEAFMKLECEGMARVDLFLEKSTGKFYFNELNTLPGFTSISMYPKLWEASGLPYKELLSKLIDLAVMRQERKKHLVREYLGD